MKISRANSQIVIPSIVRRGGRSRGICGSPRCISLVFLSLLLYVAPASAQTPQFVPCSAAQPVLNTYLSSLPAQLKAGGQPTAGAWDTWIRSQDKEIRARVEEGE